MILAAHQPHYLPYPGFLAKVAAADIFVLQDDLQYVKQEWHNRNRIRTKEGWRWLTIPVRAPNSRSRICDVVPASVAWPEQHRRIVAAHYGARGHAALDRIWRAAEGVRGEHLAEINHRTLDALLAAYAIRTPMIRESALGLHLPVGVDPNERLIALCQKLGCMGYVSGEGGLAYLDLDRWRAAGLDLYVLRWSATPYPQTHPGWEPRLSALDLLLCVPDPGLTIRTDYTLTHLSADWTRATAVAVSPVPVTIRNA
jgi:hypothetical protein